MIWIPKARMSLLGLLLTAGVLAAEPQTSPVLDVVEPGELTGLHEQLQQLQTGRLESTVEMDHLLGCRLDSPDALQACLENLVATRTAVQGELSQVAARLKNPAGEIPAPVAPEILKSPLPPASSPPVAPERPRQPETPEPVRHSKKKKWTGEQRAIREEWREYRLQVKVYEERLKQYQAALAVHQAQQADHAEQLKKRTETQSEWERLQGQHALARQQLEAGLKEQQRIIELRLSVIDLRAAFLQKLQQGLSRLPEPVRLVFFSLVRPREAVRIRANQMRSLADDVAGLRVRLSRLQSRNQAGALLGFASERGALAGDLAEAIAAADNQQKLLQEQAQALDDLDRDLQQRARLVRRFLLLKWDVAAGEPVIDQLYLDHLRELKRLSRQSLSTRPAIDPAEVGPRLASLVVQPAAVGTASDAYERTRLADSTLRELATGLVADRASLDRWREPFEREMITLLTQFASPEAQQHANRITTEFLDDLQADALTVWRSLTGWLTEKSGQLSRLGDFLGSQAGWMWMLRWLAGLACLVAAFVFRNRLAPVVTWSVRRMSKWGPMHRNMGALVGWAGFFQSLMPVLTLAAFGYIALALMGLEHTEVRFVEVPFRWTVYYLLGRQVLLGLTRRVSRGRPALVRVAPDTVGLLRVTYGRLGLVWAGVRCVDTWSRIWLGTGAISIGVRLLAWIWLAGWSMWALLAWRLTLAESLLDRFGKDSWAGRIGGWLQARHLAAPLGLLAIGILALAWLWSGIDHLLIEGGIAAWFRARTLRRMSRKAADKETTAGEVALPERYLEEFPLYPVLGEEEAILLPREDLLARVREQIMKWRESGREGSLVLVGEKGAGKTTLVAQLTRRMDDVPVVQHTISRKLTSERALLEELGPVFGLENPANMGLLSAHLNNGERQVVFLDEAHNLFLREVDGYEAYEALVRLVNFTTSKVFWLPVFNSFAWNFLNRSRRRVHYFRKLLWLPAWSVDDLQELIARRNKRSGLTIRFDEVLLGAERSTSGDIELLESAEGYFRLLRDASGGNPRVATYLWLQSLKPVSEDTLRVGLFTEASTEPLQQLDGELLFALAAICQHENLSVDELRRVLHSDLDFAGFATRFLAEYGYLEPKHTDPRRHTLAPRYYQQVLRVLRKRHLLFEEA